MPQLFQRKSDVQVQKQLVQEFIDSVTEFGMLNLHLVSCNPTPGSPVQMGRIQPAPAELNGNSPQLLQNLQLRFLPGKAAPLQHERGIAALSAVQHKALQPLRTTPLTLNIPSCMLQLKLDVLFLTSVPGRGFAVFLFLF